MRFLEKKKDSNTNSSNNRPFISPKIQPKLKIGKAGDKHEVEADAMADKVVNKMDNSKTIRKSTEEEQVQQKSLGDTITPLVQKQGAEEEEAVQAKGSASDIKKAEKEKLQKEKEIEKQKEEKAAQKKKQIEKEEKEEKPVQMQEEEEAVQAKSIQMQEEEEQVQTKSDSRNTPTPSIETNLNNSKGRGSLLTNSTKNAFESGFGTDFSKVNIHTNDDAVKMNKKLGSQAFTHGNDIYFNKGKYDPDTKKGKHLIAHELTHTLQQKGKIKEKEKTS